MLQQERVKSNETKHDHMMLGHDDNIYSSTVVHLSTQQYITEHSVHLQLLIESTEYIPTGILWKTHNITIYHGIPIWFT